MHVHVHVHVRVRVRVRVHTCGEDHVTEKPPPQTIMLNPSPCAGPALPPRHSSPVR